MIDMDAALKIVVAEAIKLRSSMPIKSVNIDFLAQSSETYLLAESVLA
jgi:hypothetical protein